MVPIVDLRQRIGRIIGDLFDFKLDLEHRPLEEDKLGSSRISDHNSNLNQYMEFLIFPISDFDADNIVAKLAEPASDITGFVIKLEFSGHIYLFKGIGRLAASDIDLDAELVVLVVSKQILFFGFKFRLLNSMLLGFAFRVIIG